MLAFDAGIGIIEPISPSVVLTTQKALPFPYRSIFITIASMNVFLVISGFGLMSSFADSSFTILLSPLSVFSII